MALWETEYEPPGEVLKGDDPDLSRAGSCRLLKLQVGDICLENLE